MEWTYRTTQGDTYDVLALDIYGGEHLSTLIQQANPDYVDVLFFPAGKDLTIPETPKTATAQPVAPWARAGA